MEKVIFEQGMSGEFRYDRKIDLLSESELEQFIALLNQSATHEEHNEKAGFYLDKIKAIAADYISPEMTAVDNLVNTNPLNGHRGTWLIVQKVEGSKSQIEYKIGIPEDNRRQISSISVTGRAKIPTCSSAAAIPGAENLISAFIRNEEYQARHAALSYEKARENCIFIDVKNPTLERTGKVYDELEKMLTNIPTEEFNVMSGLAGQINRADQILNQGCVQMSFETIRKESQGFELGIELMPFSDYAQKVETMLESKLSELRERMKPYQKHFDKDLLIYTGNYAGLR